MADRLSKLTLSFPAKAGETGKLYGSITPAMIAEAIKEKPGRKWTAGSWIPSRSAPWASTVRPPDYGPGPHRDRDRPPGAARAPICLPEEVEAVEAAEAEEAPRLGRLFFKQRNRGPNKEGSGAADLLLLPGS